jgi:hypothetical protein
MSMTARRGLAEPGRGTPASRIGTAGLRPASGEAKLRLSRRDAGGPIEACPLSTLCRGEGLQPGAVLIVLRPAYSARAVGSLAAALVDLVQLDRVAARVVDKDLLGLRAVDPGHRPVFDTEPVEFGLGLPDIRDGQRDMRDRRVLTRPFGERRGLRAPISWIWPAPPVLIQQPGTPWIVGRPGSAFMPSKSS